MRDLPTWLRGTVLGMLWGAGCGAGSAAVLALARIATGGTKGDNAYQLLVGVPLVAGLACAVGAIAGAVVGCATGLLAGLVLTATVLVSSPAVASATTVVVVLVVQAVTEVVISGRPAADNVWEYAVVPAITVLPMTCAVLRQARITRSAVRA
ncbi:MAG: hypothetical protein QOJ72_617 [Nocardioidaceae bacterium]|nr:hypothetical protein [Nocardioidaceae bacterium]